MELKLYQPKNELWLFLKYTSVNRIVFYNNKKNTSLPNFINFDSNFCKKANLLKMNNENLFKYIKNKGIKNGIFFHPKQLLNYNKNIKIMEDDNSNLYVKENNNIYNLANYCDHIYSRDLYSFLSDFDMIHMPSYYKNREIVIILFWGDNRIGKRILEKIKNFSFIFNLLIVVRDGLNYKFDDDIFVIRTKEYGNDIIPSLIGYNFINQILEFKYVIKLQTKSSDKWRVPLIDYFFNKNENQLANLLKGKEYICNEKYSRRVIYRVTPREMFMGEDRGIFNFPAGSIYMTYKEKYDGIFAFMIKYGHVKYFLQNMYDNHSILETASPIHFLERLVGLNLNRLLKQNNNTQPRAPTKLKKIILKVEQSKKNTNVNLKDLENRGKFNDKVCVTQNEYKKIFQNVFEKELNDEKEKFVSMPFTRVQEIRDMVLENLNKNYVITKNIVTNNTITVNVKNNKNNKDNKDNKKTQIKRTGAQSKLLYLLNKKKQQRKQQKQQKQQIQQKQIQQKPTVIEPGYCYYKHTSHCYGWSHIMNEINKITKNNVLIIDNVENYFIYKKMGKINSSWVGFIHEPINVPIFLQNYYIGLNLLYKNDNFINSLENCVGLISFSSNVCNNILNNVENVNIYNLKHPITLPKELINKCNDVNIEKIINQKQILFLGQHHRRNYLMFSINDYKKIWLPGLRENELKSKKRMIERICEMKKIKVNWEVIKIEYNENSVDYIKRLENNLIIISSYNSNANNAILDIISLKIPALIERNKSTEEYLGINYPGFFDINNINKILNETEKLSKRLEESKKYLINNYDSLCKKLSLKLFVSCVDSIINEKKLNHLYFVNNNILRTDNQDNIKLFEKIKLDKMIIDYYGGINEINNSYVNDIKYNNKNMLLSIGDKIVGRIRNKQIRLFEIYK